MAAWCYTWRKINAWVVDPEQEIIEAARLARRAAELGREDAAALATAGHTLARLVGDVERGAALIDRALTLNPNLAAAWLYSGWTRVWLGQPELAIDHLANAMRLSPIDPFIHYMQGATALAHFCAGRYDEASNWAEKALNDRPDYLSALRISAASNALAGRIEKAQQALNRARQLDPACRESSACQNDVHVEADQLRCQIE